jgi:hypothetical protein
MAFAPPAAGNPIAALIARAQAAHAALSGGAPGSPAGMQAPGAPVGASAGGDQGPDNASALVSQAAQLIQKAIGIERDPVERAGLAKLYAGLHQFAATEQKQKDAAMGAGPAVQMIRRTAQ